MACAHRGCCLLSSAAAFVVAGACFGFLVTVVLPPQFGINKIIFSLMPSPATPPPVFFILCCWGFRATAPDLGGDEADSRAPPMDRTPFWVDLVTGIVYRRLSLSASSASPHSVPLPSPLHPAPTVWQIHNNQEAVHQVLAR